MTQWQQIGVWQSIHENHINPTERVPVVRGIHARSEKILAIEQHARPRMPFTVHQTASMTLESLHGEPVWWIGLRFLSVVGLK